jgi:RNA polymerase sigma-70 factor (ECF subfamily)
MVLEGELTSAQRTSGRPLPEDFERIFNENQTLVYRVAYRITGSNEDAEDVLQTLCVRMLRRELPVDFEKNPKAYLYRAAVNVALNLVRSRARNVQMEPALDLEDPALREGSRGEAEIRDRLREALAELNGRSAEILILRYVHGYSDAEIAGLLGTSRGAIAVSLFRSRARLRKSIRVLFKEKDHETPGTER